MRPLLGLPALAPADDYWEARAATPYDELVRTFVDAAGVDHWIVDTGLTPGLLTDGPRSEVVRLELLCPRSSARTDVPGAFRELLRQRAAAPGRRREDDRGVPLRPRHRLVPSRRRRGGCARPEVGERVVDPVLVAFGVHEAVALGLPLQVHTGFGDRDLDLLGITRCTSRR